MNCSFDGLPIKGHQVGLFSLRSKDHWFIRHFETSVVRTILLEMADAALKKDIPTPKRRDVGNVIA